MRRKIIFALIAVVVLAVAVVIITALTGSKDANPADNTLTIWSPFDEDRVYKQISEQFLADNPDVKLVFRYVPATDAKDYEAKAVDAIAGSSGPDIWLIRTDWLAKHRTKLIDSTDYVSWSKTKKTRREAAEEYFGEAIAAQNSLDGKHYGLPLSIDSLALYINTKIVNDTANALSEIRSPEAEKLNTSPTTWDELIAWSRLITKRDARGGIVTAGLALGTTGNTYAAVDSYLGLLAQYGGSLFSDDRKAVALHLLKLIDGKNQTPGLQALTLFNSFSRPNDPNYSWNTALGDPVNAFVGNKLAMMIGYSTLSKEIQRADKNFDRVKIVPLPQVSDPAITNNRIGVANYWTHVVSKYSSKPDAAWKYLYALGGRSSQKYGQLTGKPSFVQAQDARVRISTGALGDTDLFAQQAAFAPAVYKPDWQTADEIIQDMLNQALTTDRSLQAAVDSAAERLKGLL